MAATAEQLAAARARFRELFSRDPEAAATAPGRVNLIGEHTDYNDGVVLPMAIDRECIAVGALSLDTRTTVHTLDLNRTASFDAATITPDELALMLPNAHGCWPAYIAGVLAQFRPLLAPRPLPQLDIVVTSSVPIGSGLSSSAALEVSVATLAERLFEHALDPTAKTRL